MIDFRYHLASLTAVFLALAGGIALGAGPLQDSVRGQLATASTGDDAELEEQLVAARELSDFSGAYAAATAGLVVGDRLDGTSVSLLVLPGAERAVVEGLSKDLRIAGAEVASTVRLDEDLVDPAQRQLAESLVDGLLDSVGGVEVPQGGTGYERVGGALARAVVTDSPGTVQVDGAADSILAAFEEAGFLTVDGTVERRASLALLVAGDPPADAPDGQGDVAAGLATGISPAARGTVVAGTADSAGTGVVAAVRASDARAGVSTVDGVESPAGRVVSVLALAEQVAGDSGDYGVTGADGAVPALDGAAGAGGGGAGR